VPGASYGWQLRTSIYVQVEIDQVDVRCSCELPGRHCRHTIVARTSSCELLMIFLLFSLCFCDCWTETRFLQIGDEACLIESSSGLRIFEIAGVQNLNARRVISIERVTASPQPAFWESAGSANTFQVVDLYGGVVDWWSHHRELLRGGGDTGAWMRFPAEDTGEIADSVALLVSEDITCTTTGEWLLGTWSRTL